MKIKLTYNIMHRKLNTLPTLNISLERTLSQSMALEITGETGVNLNDTGHWRQYRHKNASGRKTGKEFGIFLDVAAWWGELMPTWITIFCWEQQNLSQLLWTIMAAISVTEINCSCFNHICNGPIILTGNHKMLLRYKGGIRKQTKEKKTYRQHKEPSQKHTHHHSLLDMVAHNKPEKKIIDNEKLIKSVMKP